MSASTYKTQISYYLLSAPIHQNNLAFFFQILKLYKQLLEAVIIERNHIQGLISNVELNNMYGTKNAEIHPLYNRKQVLEEQLGAKINQKRSSK